MQVIMMRQWNLRFEEADCFVPEKADNATCKSWQVRKRDELITCHQFADFIEWIGCRFKSPLIPAFNNSDFAPVALNDRPRLDTGEREPSRHIILFGRFKEKTVTAAIEFLEGRNGRFAVSDELCEKRDDIPVF